ncbi:transmembrane protein 127-like [Orbicella faveolata]|uniref:transmembrane protein 127-like n=1 Tax=Orbicella faveolata TaxID=48498 RepID=UPI0009E46CAF|nr:transmembrane protein 127-like [Orbicella faveolata]
MLPRPLYFPYQSSYSRRRPRNRRSSRRPKPEYERNIVSAFFALASAVLLAIAEAEPKWLHIVGGKCEGKYIGMYKVIAYKHPEELTSYCFTKSIVLLLRVVVALSCAGIVFSMFACLLDLCGTMNRCLKVVKDYSVGNVMSVLMCVTSSLLIYWVTRILETVGEVDSKDPAKVKFDVSFYLVVAAGGSSVMATLFSLIMHCYLHSVRERTQSVDELELMYSMLPADSVSDFPPPAYSP